MSMICSSVRPGIYVRLEVGMKTPKLTIWDIANEYDSTRLVRRHGAVVRKTKYGSTADDATVRE